ALMGRVTTRGRPGIAGASSSRSRDCWTTGRVTAVRGTAVAITTGIATTTRGRGRTAASQAAHRGGATGVATANTTAGGRAPGPASPPTGPGATGATSAGGRIAADRRAYHCSTEDGAG